MTTQYIRIVLLWGLSLLFGAAATSFWFSRNHMVLFSGEHAVGALALLACIVFLTVLNLFVRWLRWHFMARRLTQDLRTRDGMLVWFATLPAVFTPFCLGELVRSRLLSAKMGAARKVVGVIWIAERMLDVFVLLLFYFGVTGAWGYFAAVSLLLVAALYFLSKHFSSENYPIGKKSFCAILLALSLLAWSLPVLGLWFAILSIGTAFVPISLAVESFCQGTLLGALTGIPLGMGVTASTGIMNLVRNGFPLEQAVPVYLVFRAGTAWFALGLGICIAWKGRRKIETLLKKPGSEIHFDDIADAYERQIPSHVRSRLLLRKTSLMIGKLPVADGTLLGLDLGCGQGWYTFEMAKSAKMFGVDSSEAQVAIAKTNYATKGLDVTFLQADALALPFADNTFDFAFSVNVLHHILTRSQQNRALAEINRVLKPGGLFFLNEINVENPFFRFYMGYIFPLLRLIDEGVECWIRPTSLPKVAGADWSGVVDYFTFLPDFVPARWMPSLLRMESALERSKIARWSAHFQAVMRKHPQPGLDAKT